MVFELPLSEVQSKKLTNALRCMYQFGYADTDFNDEEVARYPNGAEFYVSPQRITVVAKCYRPDCPMVVCALQLPLTQDGVPRLSSDHTGKMLIPLHILKRQLADNILPDHQLTISGDNQGALECQLNGPGEPRYFSLHGNPYEEGEIPELGNLLSYGFEVKVGFPPHVFRDVIKNFNQLGSSVTAVIAKTTIYFCVVNINQPLHQAGNNLVIEGGESFPYQLTFNIQHWKTFYHASFGSRRIWLLKTREPQRTVRYFPIDNLGHMLFTFF